jgi:acyl-CoA thioesterase I
MSNERVMRAYLYNRNLLGRLLAGLVTFGLLSFSHAAQSATINIVALGASNTAGKGVGSSAAWPAQLESMLRAKGYDVSMTVNGLNGDTSAGILSRADSIPSGTQVVIFDTGGSNDRKKGVSESNRQTNITKIASRIRAHGAKSIMVNYGGFPRQEDGIHLTPAGHAQLAARLMPQVIAAVGKRH